MTNSELHLHFLQRAEEAEARAHKRLSQIREVEERELRVRWKRQSRFFKDRDFFDELEGNVSFARAKDPLWKSAAADQQWFMQKAVMYGTAANTELLQRFIALTERESGR